MDFSRLSLLLRLPLAVLVCGLLFCFCLYPPPGDSFAINVEVEDAFDERDGEKPFNGALPVASFKLALIEQFNWVSLGRGYAPQVVPLELHATGPPHV